MSARRSKGRHVRKVRRATPRRWLPFLVLASLAAAVAVVESQTDEATTGATAIVDAPATLLPVTAERGALSTAWYCSGGTSREAENPAALSAVIANASDTGVRADVLLVGPDGEEELTSVDVPANGRIRVRATDHLVAAWAGMVVEVFGGEATVEREVSGPHGYDVAPCSTNAAETWYVPSGSTVRGAQEHLVLFNPFPDDTSVDIEFATDQGPLTPGALQAFVVPGRSVRAVPLEHLPARRDQISATVTARSGPLVVDRLQIYDGTGDPITGTADDGPTTEAPRGLASTPAIPATAPRWVFPDARNDTGARNQLAIHNPGTDTAEVDVAVMFEEPDRAPAVEPVQLSIPGGEQALVDLSEVVGISEATPYSVDVRSLQGVDVVAEMRRFGAVPPEPPAPVEEPTGEEPPEEPTEEPPPDGEDPDVVVEAAPPVSGVAVIPGSPVAAESWFLPSTASTGRAGSVVVANLGSDDVAVTVEVVSAGARRPVAPAAVTVPAGDRRSLDLWSLEPGEAVVVTGDGPVVVGTSSVSTGERSGLSAGLATPYPDRVRMLPPIS